MNEGYFRRSLQKGLEAQGCWCFKPPDLATAQIKPCDLIVGVKGKLWLVEAKIRKLPKERIELHDNILIPSLFRPHQLPGLVAVEEKGQAQSFVAVLVVPEKNPKNREAWFIRASGVNRNQGMISQNLAIEIAHRLEWVPNVGWKVPFL